MSGGQQVMRPEDIPVHAEIVQWFSDQFRVAEQKVLKYIDFREPWLLSDKTRAEELHDEYRRKVWDDTKSGTENFDKYMLTFSSGALGLSLGFIKDVVPIGKAIWIFSLVMSCERSSAAEEVTCWKRLLFGSGWRTMLPA
jgi:hypothetical protein